MSDRNKPSDKLFVTIRWAGVGDQTTVVDFNRRLAWESEGKPLDNAHLEPGVAAVLAGQAEARYLVAEDIAGKIVGQLMLTREWSDWRNGWFYWLQSVYVVPECRRQGVFRRLTNRAIDWCQSQSDVVGLRLYLERDNQRAHATYAQLGFVDPGYVVRELPLRNTIRKKGGADTE